MSQNVCSISNPFPHMTVNLLPVSLNPTFPVFQVAPEFASVPDGPLDFEDVKARYEKAMDWMAQVYVNTLNVIHYMHDKYNYERLQVGASSIPLMQVCAMGLFNSLRNACQCSNCIAVCSTSLL